MRKKIRLKYENGACKGQTLHILDTVVRIVVVLCLG